MNIFFQLCLEIKVQHLKCEWQLTHEHHSKCVTIGLPKVYRILSNAMVKHKPYLTISQKPYLAFATWVHEFMRQVKEWPWGGGEEVWRDGLYKVLKAVQEGGFTTLGGCYHQDKIHSHILHLCVTTHFPTSCIALWSTRHFHT